MGWISNTWSEAFAAWTQDWSEIALLAFGALLLVGIIGEYPDCPQWHQSIYYKLAKFAVLLGVAGELAGDGGIFLSSNRLSNLEQATIANSREQVEQLRARNNELENAVSPRFIEQDNFARLLMQFPSTHAIIIYTPDWETRRLAGQIAVVLGAAGWKIEPMRKATDEDEKNFRDGVTISFIAGVHSRNREEDRLFIERANTADALVQGLKANKIDAAAERDGPYPEVFAWWDKNDFPRDALIVRVGEKPATFFSEKRLDEIRSRSPNANTIFGNFQ